MSVALVSSPYLDDTSSKIRSKPVPWPVNPTNFALEKSQLIQRHIGIPTRRSNHLWRTSSYHQSRQTTQGKDRVYLDKWWASIRPVVPPVPEETTTSRYDAVHSCSNCRCTSGFVLLDALAAQIDILQFYLDHDERIPLFTRAVESDPELPYGPLLR